MMGWVPAVPKIGRAVWTVGREIESSTPVDVLLASPREVVPFEVHEVVEFIKTGV